MAILLVGALAASAAAQGVDAGGAAPALRDPQTYGLWVLLPAGLTILFAALTRQVLPSLALGIFVAAYMLVPCLSPEGRYHTADTTLAALRVAMETYVVGAMLDRDHLKILIFTFTVGGVVGMIAANGGTRALVNVVAKWARSSRRGQLTGWVAGMLVFFDDYANTMLVGPTLRPVFDKLGISRAKLAYIVDSTAAPVASLALMGTWLGAEIGYIQDGLDQLAATGVPAFLADDAGQAINAFQVFLYSIPYRFYPIFALLLVAIIAVTRRDFGPMLKAEKRALLEKVTFNSDPGPAEADTGRWWLAGLPILFLVGATLAILGVTGYYGGPADKGDTTPAMLQTVLRYGDPYNSILYAAVGAALLTGLLNLLARACTIKTSVESFFEGMQRMFPGLLVLVLAWALSAASQDIKLGQVATARLREAQFAVQWLPLLIFACAAIVSFATGTSWGTMGILCPVAVTIGAGLATGLPTDRAADLFYAVVGSVLAGAIFGDHCSPISDTTVLSSIATECTLEHHVWTQMPYALLAAGVAVLFGGVMCSGFDGTYVAGLALGTTALVVLVLVLGRRASV